MKRNPITKFLYLVEIMSSYYCLGMDPHHTTNFKKGFEIKKKTFFGKKLNHGHE